MNKLLIYLLSLCIAFTGCVKDASVYNLADPEVITVSGLDASYTPLSGVDYITVRPSVASNKEGTLEYIWGVYETNVQGYAAVLDTIGKT